MLCITWIEDEFLEIRSVYSWGIMYTMWRDDLCCGVSCTSLCAWRLIRAPIQRCGRVWPVYFRQLVAQNESHLVPIEILIYQHEEARFGTKSAKICTLSQKSDSRWRSKARPTWSEHRIERNLTAAKTKSTKYDRPHLKPTQVKWTSWEEIELNWKSGVTCQWAELYHLRPNGLMYRRLHLNERS